MVFVVVALVLGQLINTMFMSLYDRIREFGVMEALGSQRLNLFSMLGNDLNLEKIGSH